MVEYWSLEFFVIMSGWVSVVAQATLVTMNTYFILYYLVPLGLSFTVTPLVGHALGAGAATKAKYNALTSFVFVVLLIAAEVVVIIIFRDQAIELMTADPVEREVFASCYWVMAMSVPLHCMRLVLTAIIKAMGF